MFGKGKKKWKIGHLSDPGRIRRLNEDSVYVDEKKGLFVLADGMGGHNAGEVASSLAVNLVGSMIQSELRAGVDPLELVTSAIARANADILLESESKSAWNEMGTTLLVTLMVDQKMIIAHVGDSRAYSIKNGTITQLTEDHTFVADWVKRGLITKEQARRHHQRHGLTEAIGITEDVRIDLLVRDRVENERLLLCSDGLTEMIEDEEILTIVSPAKNPQAACNKLIEAANTSGGRDNITVILIFT